MVVTSSPMLDHVYTWGGSFNVSLTVTDGRGGSDTSTTTATIAEVNDTPVADAGGPYAAVEGGTITFDASASFDPDNQDGTVANPPQKGFFGQFSDAFSSAARRVREYSTGRKKSYPRSRDKKGS